MSNQVTNKIMLITYADSLGKNLAELTEVLKNHVGEAVGGLHILPFFPSSADRGFAPITYREVDEAFGSWEDIDRLSQQYYLMYDYMINHISAHSREYQDYLANKDQSEYRDFFIRFRDFWPNGEPTKEELERIYKRKDGGPSVEAKFADGTKEKIWSTFCDEQIDLDMNQPKVKTFIRENLEFMAGHGAALIRLDAFGYATKKPGTSCFFLEPEVWDLLAESRDILKPYGIEVLPEIHENYFTQLRLDARGYYTYDFALPLLVLHALYFADSLYLKNWLKICPRRQFTTLDTHDGIGVMDAYHLLQDDDIRKTLEHLFQISPRSRSISTKSSHTYFDAYQINCSYYSALGEDDDRYLTARAIQFFTPGIPQVYYMGMLAGVNDCELLEKTGEGRDINRRYYTKEQVKKEVERPVVQKLLRMMRFRNTHPAFDGELEILDCGLDQLSLRWTKDRHMARLDADLTEGKFEITYTGADDVVLTL